MMPTTANFAEKVRISRKKRELHEKNANFTEKARTSRKRRELRWKGRELREKGVNFAGKG
jgi:hypothetical protein